MLGVHIYLSLTMINSFNFNKSFRLEFCGRYFSILSSITYFLQFDQSMSYEGDHIIQYIELFSVFKDRNNITSLIEDNFDNLHYNLSSEIQINFITRRY